MVDELTEHWMKPTKTDALCFVAGYTVMLIGLVRSSEWLRRWDKENPRCR